MESNKEATEAETNHEAKFTLSPFWLWMVRWVAKCAKYLLIVPILMGIGYGLCARGDDFGAFVTTAFWVFVVIAAMIGILAPLWERWEKSWFKAEKSAETTDSPQPAVQTETVPVDASSTPAYKLGEKDFHNGKEPRSTSGFTRLHSRQYMEGYSSAQIHSVLSDAEEAKHE